MMVVIVATVIMMIFVYIYSDLYMDHMREIKIATYNDFSYNVQNEFIIASQSSSGYQRSFLLPDNLNGDNYNLSITGRTLIMAFKDGITYYLVIPNVSGQIRKGNNTIINSYGNVQIN